MRSTEASLARRAASEFDEACAKGDAASCSALGVLAETGQGRALDVSEAGRLYGMACDRGNDRGCVHLSRLELSGKLGDRSAYVARARLESVCGRGEAAACEELGRRLGLGDGLPLDARMGRALLEKACERRRPAACYHLALLDTPPGVPPNAWTLELFARACVRGHRVACERLDDRKRPADAARTSGVASGL